MTTIYFAGPLFSIYERYCNRVMAEKLQSFGYKVVLPQDLDVARQDGKLDFNLVAKKDAEETRKADIVVANLDGADTDSGTGVEVGIRVGTGQKVIGWRTDFRGSEDRQ